MPSRLARLAFGLLVALSATAARAEAAPPPPIAVEKVRLTAFMAPVRRADGRVRSVAVTPVLALAAAGSAAAVCDLSPRVLDAFITALYRAPLAGHGRAAFDVDSARERLTDAVNSALGASLVSAVDLVPGIPGANPRDRRFADVLLCKKSKK